MADYSLAKMTPSKVCEHLQSKRREKEQNGGAMCGKLSDSKILKMGLYKLYDSLLLCHITIAN